MEKTASSGLAAGVLLRRSTLSTSATRTRGGFVIRLVLVLVNPMSVH